MIKEGEPRRGARRKIATATAAGVFIAGSLASSASAETSLPDQLKASHGSNASLLDKPRRVEDPTVVGALVTQYAEGTARKVFDTATGASGSLEQPLLGEKIEPTDKTVVYRLNYDKEDPTATPGNRDEVSLTVVAGKDEHGMPDPSRVYAVSVYESYTAGLGTTVKSISFGRKNLNDKWEESDLVKAGDQKARWNFSGAFPQRGEEPLTIASFSQIKDTAEEIIDTVSNENPRTEVLATDIGSYVQGQAEMVKALAKRENASTSEVINADGSQSIAYQLKAPGSEKENYLIVSLDGKKNAQGDLDTQKIESLAVYQVTDMGDHLESTRYVFKRVEDSWEISQVINKDARMPSNAVIGTPDYQERTVNDARGNLTRQSFTDLKDRTDSLLNTFYTRLATAK